MMDTFALLRAFSALEAEELRPVAALLGYAGDAPRRHGLHRAWRTVLLAAVIASLLAACGYAAYRATMSHSPWRNWPSAPPPTATRSACWRHGSLNRR